MNRLVMLTNPEGQCVGTALVPADRVNLIRYRDRLYVRNPRQGVLYGGKYMEEFAEHGVPLEIERLEVSLIGDKGTGK